MSTGYPIDGEHWWRRVRKKVTIILYTYTCTPPCVIQINNFIWCTNVTFLREVILFYFGIIIRYCHSASRFYSVPYTKEGLNIQIYSLLFYYFACSRFISISATSLQVFIFTSICRRTQLLLKIFILFQHQFPLGSQIKMKKLIPI